MIEVHIDKFETRYRLSEISMVERQRLDQVRALVLDETLETALEESGIPHDAEVCLRRVTAPVLLRLSGAKQTLALDWGHAVASEVMRSLRAEPTSNAVVYYSRRHALMDMTICVSRFDLTRVWAWRQLGLWRERDVVDSRAAISEVVREICAEPETIVPMFHALANEETLNRFVALLTEHQWEKIAIAALSRAGADHVLNESSDSPSARAIRDAMHVLNGSHLFLAIASSVTLVGESNIVRRAVAALAVLDVEPTLLRTAHAQLVVEIVAGAIDSQTSGSNTDMLEPTPTNESESIDRTPEDATSLVFDQNVDDAEEESKPLDLRKRGQSQFGGLLFLLSVVDELDLPGQILAHDALGLRPFQWVLHQIALALVDVESNDPAALAFAGLAPDAVSPSDGQLAASEIETRSIADLASRIVDRLDSLLEFENEVSINVLDFVCHRSAEVVAEPGWIDIKFSSEEISTEIRRVGLDLNPGYIPWLGIVVRFVYE